MSAFVHVPTDLSVRSRFAPGECFVLRLVPGWTDGWYFWEELRLGEPDLAPLLSRVRRPETIVPPDPLLLGRFFARLGRCLSPGFLLSLQVMQS